MIYENLPKDNMMLLSLINTKLRDEYNSLPALCDDWNISEAEITERLHTIGYSYDKKLNRFI